MKKTTFSAAAILLLGERDVRVRDFSHGPSDRLAAMGMAQHYGTKMHLGVFYRNPEPAPTYDGLIRERQAQQSAGAPSSDKILDLFIKK